MRYALLPGYNAVIIVKKTTLFVTTVFMYMLYYAFHSTSTKEITPQVHTVTVGV